MSHELVLWRTLSCEFTYYNLHFRVHALSVALLDLIFCQNGYIVAFKYKTEKNVSKVFNRRLNHIPSEAP